MLALGVDIPNIDKRTSAEIGAEIGRALESANPKARRLNAKVTNWTRTLL